MNARRHARHDRIGGHVVRHHGSGADQRPLADGHAAQDDRSAADRRASAHARGNDFPVRLGLQRAVRLVARGYGSLMNITPWPTNTSSSIGRPRR